MHCGNLATSRRLQETLSVLLDGQEHTTAQIAAETKSCAVHSDVSGLRANGIDLYPPWSERLPNGCRVFHYLLVDVSAARARMEELIAQEEAKRFQPLSVA